MTNFSSLHYLDLIMSFLPKVLKEYDIDFSNELPIETFLDYGFYKIDLECGDKNAVKPTLAEVFLGIRKKKSEEK